MQRVLIVGSGGSGKSRLARELSERTGLPVVHLDAHYWQPGWVETPHDEWERVVDRLVAGDRWIMDGNYGRTLGRRLERADTVVFLDLPRRTCLWRILKRRFTHRGRTRPDMAPGCNEKADLEFLLWVWNYPQRSRPRVLALLDERAGRVRTHRLRSSRDVRRFLDRLPHARVS